MTKTLISDSYQLLNEALHSDNEEYGNSNNFLSNRLPTACISLIKHFDLESVLDYGCGKGRIVKSIQELLKGTPISVQGFDPCVNEFKEPPKPSQFLICTDVLEHIEAKFIHNTLDNIAELTERFCYLIIDLLPAQKRLQNGINAHTMIAPPGWWLDKLSERFSFGMHMIYEQESNIALKMVPTRKLVFVGAKTPEDMLPAINLFTGLHIRVPDRLIAK